MNASLLIHEILIISLGLVLLLADLWIAPAARRKLGYVAALGVAIVLLYSLFVFKVPTGDQAYAFGKMYLLDGLALFFKRFFLISALIVLLISVEFADCIETGIAEFYALIL